MTTGQVADLSQVAYLNDDRTIRIDSESHACLKDDVRSRLESLVYSFSRPQQFWSQLDPLVIGEKHDDRLGLWTAINVVRCAESLLSGLVRHIPEEDAVLRTVN